MSLPKGIINIISDYAHTLFYIEELKDKTTKIYNKIKCFSFERDLAYIFGAYVIIDNNFTFSGACIHASKSKRNLLERENERRKIIGIIQEKYPWHTAYNKNYICY